MRRGCTIEGPVRSGGSEVLSEIIKASLDRPAVPVIAEELDSRQSELEALAGSVFFAQLAIAIAEVQVETRLETSDWHATPSLGDPFVGQLIRCCQCPKVPLGSA